MKRTKRQMEYPDARAAFIACADVHLRDDVPIARTDKEYYYQRQLEAFEHILRIAKNEKVPILCAGDLFDKPRVSNELLIDVIDLLMKYTKEPGVVFIMVPGQHDLLYHNIDNIKRSSIGVLERLGLITLITNPSHEQTITSPANNGRPFGIAIKGFPFGSKMETPDWTPQSQKIEGPLRTIAIMHHLVSDDTILIDEAGASSTRSILKKFSNTHIIISGDNHQHFITRGSDGVQVLINPGSTMRMTAKQDEYAPVVVRYRVDGEIDLIPTPEHAGVITREHIEVVKERDARITAFVERLKGTEFDGAVNFQKNVEIFFRKNKTRSSVQGLVWELLEKER